MQFRSSCDNSSLTIQWQYSGNLAIETSESSSIIIIIIIILLVVVIILIVTLFMLVTFFLIFLIIFIIIIFFMCHMRVTLLIFLSSFITIIPDPHLPKPMLKLEEPHCKA